MSKRSSFQSLRDGAFVVAAFAMVLYVTLAPHHPVRTDGQLASASRTVVVGVTPPGALPVEDRVASVEPSVPTQ